MKPILLVLSVLRSVETRSLLNVVLKSAGHKLVNASGCEQAQILLSNGLNPDLILVETSGPAGCSHLHELLQSGSRSAVCLVYGPGEEHIKNQALALGITLFLERPVLGSDVCTMLEQMRNAGFNGFEPTLEGALSQQLLHRAPLASAAQQQARERLPAPTQPHSGSPPRCSGPPAARK